MKVFGLNKILGNVTKLLKVEVPNKYNPDNWSWKPSKPEKIKNWKEEISREIKESNYALVSNIDSSKKCDVVLAFAFGNLAYSLLKNLEKEQINFVYLDYVQFILKGKITVEYENDSLLKFFLQIDDFILDLNRVKFVLWTPPKFPKEIFRFDRLTGSKKNKYFFEKRWGQLIKDLSIMLPKETIWIPGTPFNGSQEWQNKVGEYKIALDNGFKIPPMIMTNNSESLLSFAEVNGSELLIREFSCPPWSFPPVKVNINKCSLKNLDTSPVCFQTYIEKKYELRVVVLFDKIFACKIDSQSSELAKSDWRVHDDANVKWEIIDLPISVKDSLIQISKELNLNWCSIDLIFSKDNEFYYLEANRPGAHYWLELFVGLDISEEIVKEIAKRIQNNKHE